MRHVLNQKNSKCFLVPFLTAMEVVAPLENDHILSGTLIWSFRHLEIQNPSTTANFRDRWEKSEEEQQQQEEQEDPIILEEDSGKVSSLLRIRGITRACIL